jgi:hypothetical protein
VIWGMFALSVSALLILLCRLEGLPDDDLTPFITRTTQDHINGGAFGDVWKCKYNTDDISAVVSPCVRLIHHALAYIDQLITGTQGCGQGLQVSRALL